VGRPSLPGKLAGADWPGSSYGLAGGTELGYRLYPAFWGRGLATEGARALIGSAFGRLRLDRVVATTMADNAGSWRVLEKCGMRRVSRQGAGRADPAETEGRRPRAAGIA
jgi:RimJ/RimL family protein N-acetyltransferase